MAATLTTFLSFSLSIYVRSVRTHESFAWDMWVWRNDVFTGRVAHTKYIPIYQMKFIVVFALWLEIQHYAARI